MRPYVHKILVVIEPLLIDEDYYARVEGREIIANLSKAAGLATMIAAMRPDIDNIDEYVRNTTARAFSVVASALGIPALLPFLKAVCLSKKSWQVGGGRGCCGGMGVGGALGCGMPWCAGACTHVQQAGCVEDSCWTCAADSLLVCLHASQLASVATCFS